MGWLQETIKELQTQISALQDITGTVAFSTTMDEAELNEYLEATETIFNSLYDKSRLLADLHDQAQNWAVKEIEQAEDLLHDTLYNLEQNMQELLTNGCIVIPITKSSANVCRLNDGTILPKCLITKKGIIPSYNIIAASQVSSIYIERNYTPVKSTMELIATQAGMVNYKLSKPADIEETLMLRLPVDFKGNHINCVPVNADIASLAAVDSNGETIELANRDGFFLPQDIREFRIKLKAKNYMRVTSEDALESTEDATIYLNNKQRSDGSVESSEEDINSSMEDEMLSAASQDKLAVYDNFENTVSSVKRRNIYLTDLGTKTIELPEQTEETAGTTTTEYYSYLFGTDKIELQKATIAPISAITFPLEIGDCDYVELTAEYAGDGFAAYFIDGNTESIIEPGKRYIPKNKTITLKIVLTQEEDKLPTIISKLAVKKYGGNTLWQ